MRQPRLLQRDVVVVVEVVEPDDFVAALQQQLRGVEADEAGRAGDEEFHEGAIAVERSQMFGDAHFCVNARSATREHASAIPVQLRDDATHERPRHKDLVVWQKSIALAEQSLRRDTATAQRRTARARRRSCAARRCRLPAASRKVRRWDAAAEFMHCLHIARGVAIASSRRRLLIAAEPGSDRTRSESARRCDRSRPRCSTA